jgi:membrane protease YdiL (CAAX protease family)
VNDSTSAISPAWPTRWPKNSFTGVWTWVLAGFIAGLFVLVFFVSVANPTPQNISASQIDLVLGVQFVIDAVLVALVLGTLPALSKFSLRELGFHVPRLSTVGFALAGAVVMIVVANGSAALIDYFAKNPHPQDIVALFKHLHDPTRIAIFAIFAVILAPFSEETLFRLFFFNLGLRYGGFWSGAVISSLLFGIAHGDLYAVFPLALGGLVLCAVYYRTRNAYASMITHALFNGFSIAALLIFPKVT